MPDDHASLPPWGSEDALEEGLHRLFDGPSPVNRIHGAIELDRRGGPDGGEHPSRATVDAARVDILAALWGLAL